MFIYILFSLVVTLHCSVQCTLPNSNVFYFLHMHQVTTVDKLHPVFLNDLKKKLFLIFILDCCVESLYESETSFSAVIYTRKVLDVGGCFAEACRIRPGLDGLLKETVIYASCLEETLLNLIHCFAASLICEGHVRV